MECDLCYEFISLTGGENCCGMYICPPCYAEHREFRHKDYCSLSEGDKDDE